MNRKSKRSFQRKRSSPGSLISGLKVGAFSPQLLRMGRSCGVFLRADGGAVAIIAGLALPVFLGFTGLALEYGQILVVRAEAQRTADLASHAGAVAYARTGDTGPMTDAARAVARLNGFTDAEIAVALDPSVPSASGAAVRATITTPKPLFLPRLVG